MIDIAMETIDNIPITLDLKDITTRLRLDPERPGFGLIHDSIAQARNLIRPRAVYDATPVGGKGEGAIEVGGMRFQSPILRRNLGSASCVFPYIITVGPELERAAGTQGDLLIQYYLEELANMALEEAASWLAERIEARFGVGPLSNMSPGSLEDWPITEQPKLFALFSDTERLVGVRLTESMLMVPRKSISGIFFPSEEGFVACQLCARERCPLRKAIRL